MPAAGIAFGSYTFPLGFSIMEQADAADLPTNKLARAHGASALARRLKSKHIVVRGMLEYRALKDGTQGSYTTTYPLRDAYDTLIAAMATGDNDLAQLGMGTLKIYSDRYYRNAQCVNVTDSWKETGKDRLMKVQVDFECPDPFQYGTAADTDATWAPATAVVGTYTHTVNYGAGSAPATGTAYAQPVITIALAASAAVNLTLTNLSSVNSGSAESFDIVGTPSPASSVIVIDTLGQIVQDNASPANDQTALFAGAGIWPMMLPGANNWQLKINTGNAATISSIGFSWLPRWW